ncbi:MAG: hypothetical protein HN546_07655 [Betaproteobacteria bacterium]|jgi:hypothetical protein|nr:hypothetical protein [Betaproteobacteria bacterium]
MGRKLGYFLIVFNALMAGYVFYFRPVSQIDPIPERSEVHPERMTIIKGAELESVNPKVPINPDESI